MLKLMLVGPGEEVLKRHHRRQDFVVVVVAVAAAAVAPAVEVPQQTLWACGVLD